MTDEQINAAIARALNADEHWMIQKNYCADLNAMHEAERFLIDAHLLFEYGMHISNSHHDEYPIRATARERAEAFLKTLGKWEETVVKESLTVQPITEKSSAVQSTSSGGASTYGGKGLGIAGATWPPETRITVNGKTFLLADIEKEMTE
jgi:hypothetical protein